MRRTLAVSLFALACSTGVYAQAVAGSGAITGIVKDIYGDGIPDTTITLSNKTNGVKRTMMTSDNGIFDAPGLAPSGSYSMKVTRKGYADWELPGFDVSVGETLNFKITLFADRTATPAEAAASLSPVQDSKTSLSSLITDDQLAALPTIARQLDPLVLLAPAVVEGEGGELAFRGEGFHNSFLFDSVDTTNRYFLRGAGIAPFITQESIAEIQVISAAAPAEFGHSMGGIVNSVTRSGSNSLHAAAYDYYNDHSWNKPDFFGNGFAPTGKQHQAGASVGLPVSTDTLFLFGNAERVTNTSQGLNRITNPLFTDATGNSVVTTGCTATVAQCLAAAAFLKAQMNVPVARSLRSTSGFARLDFRPNERESFTLQAALQSKKAPNGMDVSTVAPNGGLLASNADLTDSTRHAQLGWTHVVSGIAVNEFRGYWFRDTVTARTNPALYPSTGPVALTLAGTSIGANPAYPIDLREQRLGGSDSFTLTVGSHTIKLGADIARNEDSMDQLYARYGSYNYASLTAFATDFTANVKQLKSYSTFYQTLGNPFTDLTSTSFHGYVQDTWKVLSRLTINAGVRYEKERLPQPTQPNPLSYLSGSIPAPNSNFSPRFGLAFMVDKRTVLRVGGGTYYQPFPGQLLRDLFADGGVFETFYQLSPTALGAPAFPKVLANTSSISATLQGQLFAAQRFRNPYTEQGSAAIERRLTRYVSLAANYIFNNSLKNWTATDLNLLAATNTSETYTINNAQGSAVGTYTTPVITSTSPRRYQLDNEGSSRYRGATAQVRTAPLFGLSMQVSYTWSHASDDLSGPPSISIAPSNTAPGNYRGDTGPSQFDQRNRAVLNWTWQPVVNKKNDPVSRFLLNGWQISGVATYASTMYATPLVDVVGQQFTGIVMAYPSSLNGSGGWSRAPLQGINSLPIGQHRNLDIRIAKALPFTARLKGNLMFEVFNATNHQNNTSVNTLAYTATSGILKPVTGLGAATADYAYPYGSGARRAQVAFRLEF